jgi:uncharacterized membrane protein SirB2
MFSYEFYKVLHILGILVLFSSLGALAMLVSRGSSAQEVAGHRKFLVMLHGVAMVIVFVAGFGLMARVGVVMGKPWPTWIFLKLAIWLALGGAMVLVRKKPELGRVWLLAFPVLGAVAAYVAAVKPGA